MSDQPTTDPLWFKDAVIYETHVRAFRDANGDGIGDFRGLTQKLDYLQDLGVTALWLLPFYPSPLRDDGYDIADFGSVHPDYGTMRDVKRFVKEAHARGLKVINELVINHTSDQHAWFRKAVKSPPGSQARDFYVWSDDPNRYEDARIIFQDFERSNWSWHPEAQAYYWHRFYHHQPDLNFENPAVRTAVKRVLDQWADIGVDGMRLDAIPYLFERDGTNCENLPETHAFLKDLRSHLDRHPGRMFLAEANQWPEDAAAYFGDGDECQMNFHFPLMPRLFMSVRMEDRFPIIDILQQTPSIPDNCQWAVFLRNHDELTLEMVTDEERDYMRRVYARDPRMRINLGIRRRLAPLLDNDRRLIELLNVLLFSMPGTPVLYYGDEIGMGDNVYLGDRDGVRTPMQWSADRNAGFSETNAQRLFLPVITDPEYHFESVNVAAQRDNPASLLRWMQRLIALRRRHVVFGRGTMRFLYPENSKVLAYVREHDDEHVLVVANLSRHAQAVDLDLRDEAGTRPVELFGQTPFPEITGDPYRLTLGPYGYYWFDLAARGIATAVANPRSIVSTGAARDVIPELASTFAKATSPGGDLESVLDDVLKSQRWFAGKARTISSTSIRVAVDVPDTDAPTRLLLVDVAYTQGEDDHYVLPVRHDLEATAEGSGLLARLEKGGVVRDASANPSFARALHRLATSRRSWKGSGSQVTGSMRRGAREALELGDVTVRALGAEQSNTSVMFGTDFLVKLVRNVGVGINPEAEMTAALEESGFGHAPSPLAEVTWTLGRDELTIALFQRYVTNEGDAWAYALGAVQRLLDRMDGDEGLAAPKRSLVAQADAGIPDAVADVIGNELDAFELLGQRTAQMHNALAGRTDDEAFAPDPLGRLSQRALYQGLRTRARRTLSMVRRASKRLEGELAEIAAAVAAREDDVLAVFQDLRDTPLEGLRIRTHGDYHLGQVLWTGRDFVIIDFEGEPAAPLGERRLLRPALRDVAGMLRSFAYAGRSGHAAAIERGRSDPDGTLESAARAWATWSQVAFLRGYRQAIDERLVPGDDAGFALLLRALLLEKTLYELGYELNNRPDWVAIPLDGMRALLQGEEDD